MSWSSRLLERLGWRRASTKAPRACAICFATLAKGRRLLCGSKDCTRKRHQDLRSAEQRRRRAREAYLRGEGTMPE